MRYPVLMLLCASVAACSGPRSKLEKCHKPQEYQAARVVDQIQVPDGLEVLDEEKRLQIPAGPTKTEPTPPDQPCLIEPPDYLDTTAD